MASNATAPRRLLARDDADDRSWGLVLAVAAPIALGAVMVPIRRDPLVRIERLCHGSSPE